MKPLFILVFIFFSGITFISCDSQSEIVKEEIEPMDPVLKEAKENTISEATFNSWTKAWDKHQRDWLDTSKMTYFTMPLIDLKEVLGENISGSKFYLGLDSIGIGKFEGKLMLVGTNDKGEILVNSNDGYSIYDFTSLCPPFCRPPQD